MPIMLLVAVLVFFLIRRRDGRCM